MTASGGDDKLGGTPSPDFDSGAATTQMDPSDVAELHRRLASGPSAPTVNPDAETLMLEPGSRAADEVKRRTAAAGQAAAQRAAAAPVAQERGGVAFIMAGIGALLVMAQAVLNIPEVYAVLADPALRYVVLGLSIVGYGMLAPGLTLAVRRTNALAGVAAVFSYLLVIATIVKLSIGSELKGDELQMLQIGILGVTALAWIMIGLWGLASGRALGGIAAGVGTTALLGGLALATMIVLGVLRRDLGIGRDLLEVLATSSTAVIGLAALFLGITFFGPVRNAEPR